MSKLPLLALGGVVLALGITTASNDARACGGCFHPEDQARSTVVTGHRMALAVSPTQTVLWDQVEYAGEPDEFAWVLPIRPGAYIEVGADAWFETLDAATTTRVMPPQLDCGPPPSSSSGYYPGDYGYYGGDYDRSGCNCSPFGCAASDEAAMGAASGGEGSGGSSSASGPSSGAGVDAGVPPPPPVDVVHEGTVGPYETVTLHANDQGALTNWLIDHGYAIDADVQPIIDAYSNDGFDFIALRLLPDQGVSHMKPVRVISPGASPTLPLRMVAAGTGANVAITLFVIGEGRWETGNFPNVTVDPSNLSWNFASSSSNYSTLRQQAIEADDGRSWLTPYAKRGTLLSYDTIPVDGSFVTYSLSNGSVEYTIAGAYILQGYVDGEGDPGLDEYACRTKIAALANSTDLVVDPCPGGDGGGGSGGAGGATAAATGAGGAGGAGGAIAGTGGGGGIGGATAGAGGATAGAGGATAGAGGATAGAGGTGGGATCGSVEPGQTDARVFACGPLTDLATAMTGMHPVDVWVTRLESALPRAALGTDLDIQASASQLWVQNWIVAPSATNNQCPLAVAAPRIDPPRAGPPRRGPPKGPLGSRRYRDVTMLGLGALVLALAIPRRRGRPALVPASAR